MTRDDITKWYLKISDDYCKGKEWCCNGIGIPLIEFAQLVAAHEREECAKACESTGILRGNARDCARVIRARGQE
jgi:hypothetical protein